MSFNFSKITDRLPIPETLKRLPSSLEEGGALTKVVDYATNMVSRHWKPDSFVLSDLTPYRIIASTGLMSVRYYPPLAESTIAVEGEPLTVISEQRAMPILMVPPLGVSAWIFDLLEERSLVKYMLAHGYPVYLVDWGEPDRSHAHLSLEDYVLDWLPEAVASVKAHSNSRDEVCEISMLGYCMGGLLTLLYVASAQDDEVKNVVTVASPIDFHASGTHGKLMGYLREPLNELARVTRFSLSHLNPLLFHTSGERLSWLFKMTNPMSNVTSYFDLLINMADKNYVATHMTMSRWFNEMVDYPGATLQNIMAKMLLDNQMARGYVGLGMEKVPLKNIKANLLTLAGSADRIVGIKAARRAMDVVSSEDKLFEVVPGGHAGVFAGAKAPANTWSSIIKWLDKRSYTLHK